MEELIDYLQPQYDQLGNITQGPAAISPITGAIMGM
jgi:hypothetical protein